MSDAFHEREDTFEKRFANDEALRFRAVARRNKAVALWAADLKGLSPAAAEKYADDFVGAWSAPATTTSPPRSSRTSRATPSTSPIIDCA